MGPFNNYVTLKLPLLTNPPPAITLRHEWLQDPSPILRYVTPDTDPPFIIYFSFLKLKRKQIYDKISIHPYTSTHVFMQLNQIVRFK